VSDAPSIPITVNSGPGCAARLRVNREVGSEVAVQISHKAIRKSFIDNLGTANAGGSYQDLHGILEEHSSLNLEPVT